MKPSQPTALKIYNKESLIIQLAEWRSENKSIVFTNGVFDILHKGHLILLSKTAELADLMIVGLNSDTSVKRLKGESRPVNDEGSRALMLAALQVTDGVIIFEEDTPFELINFIKPDVLVKGGDYTTETIVGAEVVINNGGKVIVIDLEQGFSTTATIAKIKEQNKAGNNA